MQANSAAKAAAWRILAQQLDSRGLECGNHLDQSIDDAAHLTVGSLHPLDGRQGQAGEFGKLSLVKPEKRPGGAHLL